MLLDRKHQGVKVSICMLAYNQENFIRQAIEGVLIQKTNFLIELVIGEDYSTDKTREICLEYKNQHPDVIQLITREKNVGVAINSVETLNLCKGTYIAFCEGDDYWTDPNKLQKQVDFMDQNTDFALVYHRVALFDEDRQESTPEKMNNQEYEIEYSIEDLTKSNFIHTPSVLIRNHLVDYSVLLNSKVVGDYYLWILCAELGKIKYLPDVMAVYRVWNGSVWEKKNKIYKAEVWIGLLIVLLNRLGNNSKLYAGLFHQLHFNYRIVLDMSTTEEELKKLDVLTKTLLVNFEGFRTWWFSYMAHLKRTRQFKLAYLFYLIKKGIWPGVLVCKKALA